MLLLTGSANPALGHAVAERLGTLLGPSLLDRRLDRDGSPGDLVSHG